MTSEKHEINKFVSYWESFSIYQREYANAITYEPWLSRLFIVIVSRFKRVGPAEYIFEGNNLLYFVNDF